MIWSTTSSASVAPVNWTSIRAALPTSPVRCLRRCTSVMGLVAGGYGPQEILAAFRHAYGERVLMSPVKEGFNWVGYIAPFAALGTGALVLFTLIRHWSRPASALQL